MIFRCGFLLSLLFLVGILISYALSTIDGSLSKPIQTEEKMRLTSSEIVYAQIDADNIQKQLSPEEQERINRENAWIRNFLSIGAVLFGLLIIGAAILYNRKNPKKYS